MRAFALPALILLAACNSGGNAADNGAVTAAQQASEREADADVVAAESDAANVAATDAELDRLANEVGEPATNAGDGR